jgi:oligoribonuclease
MTEARDAERALMAVATRWCDYPAVLCGNSIASDRKFIDRYMPGLAGYLHYRMVDVSAIKVLAAHWYGGGAQFQKRTNGEHDALFDIRNSIAELQHYRDTLFRTP